MEQVIILLEKLSKICEEMEKYEMKLVDPKKILKMARKSREDEDPELSKFAESSTFKEITDLMYQDLYAEANGKIKEALWNITK